GTTYLRAVASLDGYIADERDDVGPLHDWYFSGGHLLVDEDRADGHGAPFRVSAASAGYVRGMWSRQKVLVIGRHQFDLTNGWEGRPPAGDPVVVVSHPLQPTGWHPEASYHLATSVEEGNARAPELAGGGGWGGARWGGGGGRGGGGHSPGGGWSRGGPSSAGGSGTWQGSLTATCCWRIPNWLSRARGCSMCFFRCVGDAGCPFCPAAR